MARRYDYFVIFAEMRTGSNVLERNLRQLKAVKVCGEAFNPDFIGQPKWGKLYDVTYEQRLEDPLMLLDNMAASKNILPGFRFFFDHDPRVVDSMLGDPRCGKIILTRNPLDSYISVKLATNTDTWVMTHMTHGKSAKVNFMADHFDEFLDNRIGFQERIQRALQVTGQSAFYLRYEDINDLDVLNGIAAFLGVEDRIDDVQKQLMPQFPIPMEEKVQNFDEMKDLLKAHDPFRLNKVPMFEPERSTSVPNFVAGHSVPLIFLPIKAGPYDVVLQWMVAYDGGSLEALHSGFDQKTLRKLQRSRPNQRSFAVLRHPVARAHAAFCRQIVNPPSKYWDGVRKRLCTNFNLGLPPSPTGADYDIDTHRAAFIKFLGFLRGNLQGQTHIKTSSEWATQFAVLEGMSKAIIPDVIIREEALNDELNTLARKQGLPEYAMGAEVKDAPFTLKQIYSAEVEAAAKAAYQRDYVAFGFAPWGDS
ncbi:MAG: nodulation protein NodH [Paracoccaceae bacterium]|nr:nodulation protein NodH [Paracoccaceae bacterium]